MNRNNLKFKTLGFRFILIALVISACSSTPNQVDTSSPKFKQYYIQGEELYIKHCSNCHQKNGTGLGLVYPPLNKSDYMDKNLEKVLCLMKYGISDTLIVNGKMFNQPMPGVLKLTNLEIAEIATYIYNTWDNNRGLIDVKEATRALDSCAISN